MRTRARAHRVGQALRRARPRRRIGTMTSLHATSLSTSFAGRTRGTCLRPQRYALEESEYVIPEHRHAFGIACLLRRASGRLSPERGAHLAENLHAVTLPLEPPGAASALMLPRKLSWRASLAVSAAEIYPPSVPSSPPLALPACSVAAPFQASSPCSALGAPLLQVLLLCDTIGLALCVAGAHRPPAANYWPSQLQPGGARRSTR